MQVNVLEAKGDMLFAADQIDISRTVGWFTVTRLLALQSPPQDDPLQRLQNIRQQIERIPSSGFGPPLLTWGNDDPETRARGRALESLFSGDIQFNFRGPIDSGDKGGDWMKPAQELAGQWDANDNQRNCLLAVYATIIDGCLDLRWEYGCNIHRPDTAQSLLDACLQELKVVAARCTEALRAGEHGSIPERPADTAT
jgi:non-ribosomal peptide synthase protein (TIGR01720 family)